jgi:hypothetical protein
MFFEALQTKESFQIPCKAEEHRYTQLARNQKFAPAILPAVELDKFDSGIVLSCYDHSIGL